MQNGILRETRLNLLLIREKCIYREVQCQPWIKIEMHDFFPLLSLFSKGSKNVREIKKKKRKTIKRLMFSIYHPYLKELIFNPFAFQAEESQPESMFLVAGEDRLVLSLVLQPSSS